MRLKEEYREETVINRSRFIACVAPARSEQEARDFIESIRKEYADATHVCTAYMCGENNMIQRSSDNHEPSGTAGVPMLESIRKSGLSDVVACVVRYFGGIKLGAGGLIRAYSGSVADALAHAKKVTDVTLRRYSVTYPYDMSGTVETWLRRNTILDALSYDEEITASVLAKDEIEKPIRDLSRGRVEAEFLWEETAEQDVD
ncbi:MAG: YigZ family protein [Solobacterium sp.]|nr:YigZ family protein [Solobacterium sp.]